MGKILLVPMLRLSRKRLLEMQNETVNLMELYNWSTMPLGVLSIESYAHKTCPECQTEIIDLNRSFFSLIKRAEHINDALKSITDDFSGFLMREIAPALRGGGVGVVGLSAIFDLSLPALEITAAEIKKISPGVIVIAGGHPCTNFALELVTRCQSIDAVSIGEGEIPFAGLAAAQDKSAFIAQSDFFVTPSKIAAGQSAAPVQATFISDLDDIPMFRYEAYIEKYGDSVLYEHSNVLDKAHNFNRQAVIMTSRGCPYNCTFCAAHAVHGHNMRTYSLERVKQEIDLWVDRYHAQTIAIVDDHILFDVERAISICDYIGSKGAEIRFVNGLAIAPITPAFVECLKRNHVKEVALALESGCERVLREVMHKPLSLQKADEVFELFRDSDIFVKANIVVGFPDETLGDVENALAYLRRANFHWLLISNLIPISGSRIYEKLIKEQNMEYSLEDANFFVHPFANEQVSRAMLGDVKYTISLDINFVHNAYMRMGKYRLAAQRFQTMLESYPGHAFAHYYLAKCYSELGESADEAYATYLRIVRSVPFWMAYANYFHLSC